MKHKPIVFAMSLSFLVFLAGCDSPNEESYVKELKAYSNYSGVTIEERGYVSYTVEQRDGTLLSCRDHAKRSELTCWPVELE
jgi:hypothetical protein